MLKYSFFCEANILSMSHTILRVRVFFEVSIFLAIHYKNKLYLDGFLAVKISKISIMIITGSWHNRYFPPAGL